MQRINQRKGQCRFMYEVDREQEILKYLPLVERVANRISIKNTEYEYDDLYNIGVIGLIDAMQKFDSSKKFRLKTMRPSEFAGPSSMKSDAIQKYLVTKWGTSTASIRLSKNLNRK